LRAQLRRYQARSKLRSTCGLVAMTSASHAEGRQFDPGQVYFASCGAGHHAIGYWGLAVAHRIPFGDHPLGLERYRGNQHGPCAGMTPTTREVQTIRLVSVRIMQALGIHTHARTHTHHLFPQQRGETHTHTHTNTDATTHAHAHTLTHALAMRSEGVGGSMSFGRLV
jgi:hypothetical protein